MKIRALISQAPSKKECWTWGPKSRNKARKAGIVIHEGQRLNARRVLIEWLIGPGYAHHFIKPVCGDMWCHNPFHQRLLKVKGELASEHVLCSRGHDVMDPANYKMVSRPDGRKFKKCMLCYKLARETDYRQISKKIKRERKANSRIVFQDTQDTLKSPEPHSKSD